MGVFQSASGPAASDSEDRFAGADNSQTRWHTGAVYHAEPYRDHHLDHAHPEHSSASPGKQPSIFIKRFLGVNNGYILVQTMATSAVPLQSNVLLLVPVPRH